MLAVFLIILLFESKYINVGLCDLTFSSGTSMYEHITSLSPGLALWAAAPFTEIMPLPGCAKMVYVENLSPLVIL